ASSGFWAAPPPVRPCPVGYGESPTFQGSWEPIAGTGTWPVGAAASWSTTGSVFSPPPAALCLRPGQGWAGDPLEEELLASDRLYQPTHHRFVVTALAHTVYKLRSTGERLKRLILREALLDWRDLAARKRLEERLGEAAEVLRAAIAEHSARAEQAEEAAESFEDR
ncbi:unnamed protein product, partial [Polarella glacialis]